MDLTGKRILVTGAGSGIGRACVKLAYAAGAHVALAGRSRAKLAETAQVLGLNTERSLVLTCDVSREPDVVRVFSAVVDAWGGVDGVVNSAGVFRGAPFPELTLETWNEVLGVNLTGTFLICREAFRRMSPGGSIVNIGSLSGVPGVEKFPGFAAYNVSKYGVSGLTEILAVEGRSRGLRVNCVSPGAVNTAMLKLAAPQLPPALEPEDVARTVVYLLSDESRAVTRANLVLLGEPGPAKERRP
jgi:NAD(P)-dependent dehydrogenase (short-subunit alcohol dehydrogenase family)